MRNKKKRMSKRKKVLISVLSIILCLVLVGGIYTYIELNKVKSGRLSDNNSDLGISDAVDNKLDNKNVTNIALFGVDSRNTKSDTGSRSDSMLILSIDKEHNKIKLTSLMRDLYVSIDGHGMTKLTHAYAYGGPQLAVKTINENFSMNIKDYVTVDFFSLEKIIDSVGGVQINVKKDEISDQPGYGFNYYIKELSDIEKKSPKYVTKPGLQTLNGLQAVAYSRIRNTAGSDYARTQRQRDVLSQVISKASKLSVTKYPGLLNNILPYIKTSLSKTDMLAMATSAVTNGITNVEQLRLPEDGFGQGQMINKVYYLVADLNTAKKQLYKFIYEKEDE